MYALDWCLLLMDRRRRTFIKELVQICGSGTDHKKKEECHIRLQKYKQCANIFVNEY